MVVVFGLFSLLAGIISKDKAVDTLDNVLPLLYVDGKVYVFTVPGF